MTPVEVYVDPACPWAWITARWIADVGPQRDLAVTWQSFCLEIRDGYELPAAVPAELRESARAGRALSHRMLRIFEAAREQHGEDAVDALYREWGRRFFGAGGRGDEQILEACVRSAGLGRAPLAAADDEAWDRVIVAAMEEAYAFAGVKTQTPAVVVRSDPPYGFKGPVMAPAPPPDRAAAVWDALQILAREPGLFEITRPRANPPFAHTPT